MYSRRQRSTRNTAVATNANATTNARTTRGRTSKAKNPRRGGNPDTARVRASIERPPVVPWIKVMRPPALHLRRTFLVEKWVRPSDLTEKEREVYEAEQKKKEEERQRMLKFQQQKREQEEKEKAEQQQREQQEKEQAQLAAAAAAAQGGENVKPAETKQEEQSNDQTAAKLVSGTPAAPASEEKGETEHIKAATTVASMEVEQTPAPLRGDGAEAAQTPAPTSTTDSAQVSSEQTQTSLTENKPMAPLATMTNPDSNSQEQKQEVPTQNTEQESKQVPQLDSAAPDNPSVTKPPAEESQAQEQEQPKPSDTVVTSVSTEPVTKKQRVE